MEYIVSTEGWPLGVDNIHYDWELSAGSVRRAVNLDILDSGKMRSRRGFTEVLALTGAHSLWGDGDRAYFAYNNVLYEFFADGTSSSIGAFACGSNRVAYAKVGDTVYATCATARCQIVNGVMGMWGIDSPATAATLAATTGNLLAGDYHVVVTYLTADGRESGTSPMATITLASTGGIVTTALPVSSEAGATLKRLYLSTADGEVMYMAAEVSAASQFVTITDIPTGPELRTEFLIAPPYGSDLTYYNGRLFIVDAAEPSVVWHTEALSYGHVNRLKGYYTFKNDVALVAGVDDGVYVASDNTWFIAAAGTPEHSLRVVMEDTAIARTATTIPDTTDSIWASPRGAVVGRAGGEIEVLSKNSLAIGSITGAAALVREGGGVSQYVVVGTVAQDSPLQNSEFTVDNALTGWAYNLTTKGASAYHDYTFNSFARIGDQYFGCAANGINELTGTDDNGTEIATLLNLGKSDLRTERVPGDTRKSVPYVYVTAKSAEPMNLTVRVEGSEYTYAFRNAATAMKPVRVEPGRGLTGVLWEYEITNTAGAAVEIGAVRSVADKSTRRI